MEKYESTVQGKDEQSSTSQKNYSDDFIRKFFIITLIELLLVIVASVIIYHLGYVAGEQCAIRAVDSLTGGFC
jgi:hypothetical protein